MRSVQLQMTVTGRPATDVYGTLADFSNYPEFSPAVHHVTVTKLDERVSQSEWEVAFRAGILKWVEEDTFHRDTLRIDFRQLEGDMAIFEGSWACFDTDDGAAITFAARLDMGIPTLADALEPIAVRALLENIVGLISGLFGEAAHVDSTHLELPAPYSPYVDSNQ
jgi:ribosome-associated toxin RatA of RatAB toxin-antitoxin module